MKMCRWITLFTLAAAAFAAPTIASAQAQAQAQAQEPAADQATRRVYLPGMGIEADIPAGNVEWEVKADEGGDQFTRTTPATPALVVNLQPLEVRTAAEAVGCSDMLDYMKAEFPNTVSGTNPTAIPPGWYPEVVLVTTNPIYLACKEFERGVLMAAVTYSAGMSVEEFFNDTFALLRAIEVVVPAKLGQPIATSAAPQQTAPPQAANQPPADGKLRLPRSGLVVEHPATNWIWGARQVQGDDSAWFDQIYRIHPEQPSLRLSLITFRHMKQVKHCWKFMKELGRDDGRDLRHFSFIPGGWHPAVQVSQNQYGNQGVLCFETPDGIRIVFLNSEGSLDDPALVEVKPMLDNLGKALHREAAAKSGAQPSSRRRNYSFSMNELNVTDFVGYVINTDHEEGADYGGGVRLEYLVAGDGYSLIGFAGGFRAVFGWDTAGLLLDGRMDAGPAIRPVSMLTLVPFVSLGVGGQGISQEDESRKMGLGLYFAAGGRARLELIEPLGLDLMAWRTFRYDEVEVDHFEARLLFGGGSAYSLGAHYETMPHGDMLGISFGWTSSD